jgi:hypothetical protein
MFRWIQPACHFGNGSHETLALIALRLLGLGLTLRPTGIGCR